MNNSCSNILLKQMFWINIFVVSCVNELLCRGITFLIWSRSQECERGLIGLQNIGNTCYLNSVIQCLSNTKPLLEYILSKEYYQILNNSSRSFMTKRFADLIRNIWDENGLPSTNALKHAVSAYAPRFLGSSQHDSQEFLRYLLEGLHGELNRASQSANITSEDNRKDAGKEDSLSANESWRRYLKSDNSIIVDVFGGQLKSVLKCTFCGYPSTIFEPFWDLSIPIPLENIHSGATQLHLNQCLNDFTKGETLKGNESPTCSKCKMKQTCIKQISFQKLPPILVIHLKRFTADLVTQKVNTYINIPVTGLDMSPYFAEANIQRGSCLYNLYGVVNHYGGCNFGHYTAFCKHPFSGEWHSFNDRSVTHIRPDVANSSDAYMLFYEAV